jgi:pyruvate, orthophosphate dikinase
VEKELEISLEEKWPPLYEELKNIRTIFENYYHDACDIEFTVQEGKLYILQTRVAKRLPRANLKLALDFWLEGKINANETLSRISLSDVEAVAAPVILNKQKLRHLGKGIPASYGAARGRLVLSGLHAVDLITKWKDTIFAANDSSPEDVRAMLASKGVLTTQGGMTSHTAVVSRGFGIPCITGFAQMQVKYNRREIVVNGCGIFREGAWITIDAGTGIVYAGKGTIAKKDWKSSRELMILASLINHLIASGDILPQNVGIAWQIRDFFFHLVLLREERSQKKAVSKTIYT